MSDFAYDYTVRGAWRRENRPSADDYAPSRRPPQASADDRALYAECFSDWLDQPDHPDNHLF